MLLPVITVPRDNSNFHMELARSEIIQYTTRNVAKYHTSSRHGAEVDNCENEGQHIILAHQGTIGVIYRHLCLLISSRYQGGIIMVLIHSVTKNLSLYNGHKGPLRKGSRAFHLQMIFRRIHGMNFRILRHAIRCNIFFRTSIQRKKANVRRRTMTLQNNFLHILYKQLYITIPNDTFLTILQLLYHFITHHQIIALQKHFYTILQLLYTLYNTYLFRRF